MRRLPILRSRVVLLLACAAAWTAGVAPSSALDSDSAGTASTQAAVSSRSRTAKAPRRRVQRRPVPSVAAEQTVTLVAGQPGTTTLEAASDLSNVVSSDRLRVLVVVGSEGERNVNDVLRTRGVDMGIVTAADLRRAEQSDVTKRVVYIAKLYNTELHILAKPDVRHLTDLDERTVNLGEPGSSTQVVAQDLLRHYGIRFKELNLDQREAVSRMKADGDIAATFILSGKPAAFVAGLRPDSGLHLLGMPYEPSVGQIFYPASLGSEDYPDLIAKDAKVDTIAVTSALVAFDWPEKTDRSRRIESFTGALFANFDQMRGGARHPKWREVNLAAEFAGWRRAKAAELALARGAAARAATSPSMPAVGPESASVAEGQKPQVAPR